MLAAMGVVAVEDVGEFTELAMPLLERDPLRNTVALSVLDQAGRVGERLEVMLVARDPDGVALRTAGRLLLASAMPVEHAEAVARAVAEHDPDCPGVAGPLPGVTVLAEAIAAGRGVRTYFATRLFELGTLVEPAAVPGAARVAGVDDLAVLARWRVAFSEEAHGGWRDPVPPEEFVRRSLLAGVGELFWEVDGVPVALAAARPVVAGMSRIGPVYTPPEHRRHGYGAAVTAAATRWASARGAERVVLFTDLANPTSNALYPRLGYRPVCDMADLLIADG
jgi:GNAT superfamily N-acetyltransferase